MKWQIQNIIVIDSKLLKYEFSYSQLNNTNTDRHTDRWSQTYGNTDTWTHIQTYRHTDVQIYRQRHTNIQKQAHMCILFNNTIYYIV